MRAHSKSDSHILSSRIIRARGKTKEKRIFYYTVPTYWRARERIKNRSGIKVLLLCTHFLARQHIPHTTNFDKLVDLVVSCGGEDLKQFADRAGRN